jgi:hypothetical protein
MVIPPPHPYKRGQLLCCEKQSTLGEQFVTTPSSRINAYFSNSIVWFISNLQRIINNQKLQQKIYIYKSSLWVNATFVIFVAKAPI